MKSIKWLSGIEVIAANIDINVKWKTFPNNHPQMKHILCPANS